MGWLTGWDYRKSHIVNTAVGAGTNYQTGIKVYRTAGTDGTETVNALTFGKVYVGTNCLSDFGDIRFTSADGSTELDYWMFYRWDDNYAFFWVEVPDDLGAGNATIYIYYGNAGASTTSNDVNTMLVGADFDDGSTTGLVINTAGGATVTVPALDFLHSLYSPTKPFGKYGNNPVIARRAGKWDSYSVRDIGFVVDEDGFLVKEAGKYVVFHAGRDGNGNPMKIGIAKSVDGLTFTDRLDTPVRDVGAGGSWCEIGIASGQVIKRTSDGLYEMMAYGMSLGDSGYDIGYLSSNDGGASWVDGGEKLSRSQFEFADTSNPITLGVTCVIKLSSGDYFLVFEAQHSGGEWAIFAATAASMSGAWTPYNGGDPIFTKSGAGWDVHSVANPKLIEIDDGKYILMYNGKVTVGGFWSIGFATSTDLTTWTRYASNPVLEKNPIGDTWDDVHTEASALIKYKDTHRTYIYIYYQGFLSVANEAQIGVATNCQTRWLKCTSSATADGWIVGKDLDAITTFMVDTILGTTDESADSSSTVVGLVDSAAVPIPMINTSFNPLMRFVVFYYSQPNAHASQILIRYTDTGGSSHYWNGSSWVLGASYHGLAGSKEKLIVRIWDDGTNYKCDVLRLEDGVSILANPASIAKVGVKTFSNGRVFIISEPFTSHYYLGLQVDHIGMRNFVDPEPAHSTWGSEEGRPKLCSGSIIPLMRGMGLIGMLKRFPKFIPFTKTGIG